MSTYILGVNSFHGDSSACLLRDGEVVAAIEEERLRRIKHWAGFPSQSIAWCLEAGGISLGEVRHIAINQDSRAAFGRRLAYLVKSRPSISLLMQRLGNKRKRAGIRDHLRDAFGDSFNGKVHFVEHHLAHLASAYLLSPFERAAVVSIDGFGDFASCSWGVGERGRLAMHGRVSFPHSLGILYEAVTQYLGFPNYGDEYKVMGLAPYGEPRYVDSLSKVISLRDDGTFELDLEYFRHATERVEYEWNGGNPQVGSLYSPKLEALLGPARAASDELSQRHRDVARSVQAVYESAAFNLLNAVARRYRTPNLALAGGCAMNSVANGKVYASTPFRQLYVQAAAGDAGGALGAALVAWQRIERRDSRPVARMNHAYWGPQYSPSQIREVIEASSAEIAQQGCVVSRMDDDEQLCGIVARHLSEGRVVGWFQGRMEWGPRALGNRSILCDPRLANMKDILNAKIKRRESFRPFAPSILREHVGSWFEVDDDVPFMTQVYPIRQERRSAIPAVTHVDGTGRLQTVTDSGNALYYRLIERFHALTGVPMVLNTSFNENEPVVCKPQEALDCFLRTKMDVLALGGWVITRA